MYLNTEPVTLTVPYAATGAAIPEHAPELLPVCIPASEEIGKKARPAVVICPGGGYDFCSHREDIPVAMRFAGYGVQAFVLRYTCRMRFPTALTELAAAVAYVRTHAAAYEVDADRIAVLGFSAGAHLAGSLAVYWNQPLLRELGEACRPNAQILCYPVITGGESAHRGSIVNLVGEAEGNDPASAGVRAVSLEQQVSAETPPCFLWHTSDDNCVPVQNSLLYMQSLAANAVPFEAHIYPHGAHGLSFADETAANGPWHLNPVCAPWFSACIAWIRRGFH